MTIPNTDLSKFVERIQRLNEDIKIAQQDLKEVYAEAESSGLDKTVIRKLVKLMDLADSKKADKAKERASLLGVYAKGVGHPELPDLFV